VALRVVQEVLEAIAAHAREAAPQECCGVLLAESGASGAVTAVLRAENAEPDRPERRYRLDRATQLAALDLEIEGRTEVVGYYHSHPAGPPSPSPTDVAEAIPETLYLICGLGAGLPEFAVWRSGEGRLTPVPLEAADG